MSGAALLCAAASCTKTGTDPDVSNCGYITVSPGIGTKALLTSADAASTVFTLYGIAGNSAVIAGKTLSANVASTNAAWNIEATDSNGGNYPWENNKDYKFFSWTAGSTSATTAAATFFGSAPSYNSSNGKLSIPSKAMPIDDTGFDFCWSDIVTRAASSGDYSTVVLSHNHLFAAFSLSAHNYTSQPVVIQNVKLYGVHHKKSAVVDFSGTKTAVTYTASTGAGSELTGSELISEIDGVTLAAGTSKANIIKGAGNSRKYVLMWPQTKADLEASSYTNSSTKPTDSTDPDAYIEVKYTQNGGDPITVFLEIPQDETSAATDWAWPAGVRQNMELSFSNKSLSLTVSAGPWNQTTPSYDYEGAVQYEAGSFGFDENSKHINPSGTKDVYFEPGYPIIMTFKINSPENASWMVEKVGDFDAFEIDNVTAGTGTGVVGDGDDTKEGVIDGDVARIAIYPKITDPQKDYRIRLSFSVRGNNGVVTNINDLVQPDGGYTFYILK